MISLCELTEKEKKFIGEYCSNCDKLYDCDNNAHEEQWKECMKKIMR